MAPALQARLFSIFYFLFLPNEAPLLFSDIPAEFLSVCHFFILVFANFYFGYSVNSKMLYPYLSSVIIRTFIILSYLFRYSYLSVTLRP